MSVIMIGRVDCLGGVCKGTVGRGLLSIAYFLFLALTAFFSIPFVYDLFYVVFIQLLYVCQQRSLKSPQDFLVLPPILLPCCSYYVL